MLFERNQLLSITDVTRRFRVLDTDLETWSKEGFFPSPIWVNGRKYWKSEDINLLVKGCELKPLSPAEEFNESLEANIFPIAFLLVTTILIFS